MAKQHLARREIGQEVFRVCMPMDVLIQHSLFVPEPCGTRWWAANTSASWLSLIWIILQEISQPLSPIMSPLSVITAPVPFQRCLGEGTEESRPKLLNKKRVKEKIETEEDDNWTKTQSREMRTKAQIPGMRTLVLTHEDPWSTKEGLSELPVCQRQSQSSGSVRRLMWSLM